MAGREEAGRDDATYFEEEELDDFLSVLEDGLVFVFPAFEEDAEAADYLFELEPLASLLFEAPD